MATGSERSVRNDAQAAMRFVAGLHRVFEGG